MLEKSGKETAKSDPTPVGIKPEVWLVFIGKVCWLQITLADGCPCAAQSSLARNKHFSNLPFVVTSASSVKS